MRVRLIAVAACVLLIAAVVPPVTGGAVEPVRIGVIPSLTGRFATFGKMQMAGYNVALKEINATATTSAGLPWDFRIGNRERGTGNNSCRQSNRGKSRDRGRPRSLLLLC